MKLNRTVAIVTLFLFALLLPITVTPVFADMTTTDVQIATESGATYLTTTTISTTSTVVATPIPPRSTPIPTSAGPFYLPSGFFPSANALTNQIFRIIMVIAVVLVFAYLVLGGIQYITSGGEKAKTEAARNKIVSAIVGLIIVASSYAILTIILNFIGYRDTGEFLDVGAPGPTVLISPTPTPLIIITPTPTPTSPLQKLLQ